MHDATGQYYDTHAEQLAARYRGADVTSLHVLMRRWLPASGSVLEIGCGIGRESAFISALGLDVLATDASEPMLAQARFAPGNERVTFQPGAFPLQPGHPLLQARFDAVVAIAVLMHVPDHELFDFAFQIRGLLNPGGRFICSFCSGRTPSEEDPRLYADREPGEVRLLFERLGFIFLSKEENEDGLGRGTRWTTLVFGCEHQPGSRPVDQIEAVINHDKKDATYKLALMRALCDIAQTAYRQVRWHPGDTVSVPLGLLAEKWLYYYWPLVDTGDEPLIPQKRGMEINKPIAFRKELAALATHFSLQNGLSRFHGEFRSERLDPEACLLTDAALNKIAETIVAGPVKFSSQGGFMSQGRQSARNRCHTPQALYASLGRVHFNADIWRELCLVGHWISEAIILRWAELTVEISKRQVPITRVLEKLLVRPETDRDVCAVREIYKACPGLTCVWTQADLTDRRFDVDHAIPFSLWHNNDLWNLLPADAKVNNEKRDRLVDRETLFRSREAIISCWQITRHAMPERFDLELSRSLFGRNHAETKWEIPAFAALTEAVETVALQRGVDRWQPARPVSTAAKERASRRQRAAAESESYDAGDSLNQSPPASPALELDGKRSVAHYHVLPRGRTLIDPAEVPQLAFKSALPIVAELAAGTFFDGFETGRLNDLNDLDWITVPEKLCKPNRFVIRVAGDSMEPLFHIGDLLVFEYHRTPRLDNQIVIAADFTSGSEGGEYAVKRLKSDPSTWLFISDNPAYAPVQIPKAEMSHPILGTYVDRLSGSHLSQEMT